MPRHRWAAGRRASARVVPASAIALPAAALLLLVSVAGLASGAAAAETPGLRETRSAAEKAARDHADAQSHLGLLEGQLDSLRHRRDEAERELVGLRGTVQKIAVDRYTVGESSILLAGDLNEHARAEALTRYVTQNDIDALDRYRALRAQLDDTNESLEEKLADQEEALDELTSARGRLDRELQRLEGLEADRLADVARERQRAEQRAAAAAAARAATPSTATAERDVALAPTTSVGTDQSPGPTPTPSPAPPSPVPAPPAPPSPPPSPGTIVCPVPGSVFVDSFGAPRSGGRRHEGVDMMASRGRPVYAPVSGSVSHRSNSLGGMSFHLDGNDGRYYYGAHLSGYGQGGQVPAGTVIGYVGDSGNATGNPHLHFEIHVNGTPVNPYPYVRAVC